MRDGLRMFGDLRYPCYSIRYRRGKVIQCEYVLAFYHSIASLKLECTY